MLCLLGCQYGLQIRWAFVKLCSQDSVWRHDFSSYMVREYYRVYIHTHDIWVVSFSVQHIEFLGKDWTCFAALELILWLTELLLESNTKFGSSCKDQEREADKSLPMPQKITRLIYNLWTASLWHGKGSFTLPHSCSLQPEPILVFDFESNFSQPQDQSQGYKSGL
ncbi:hypothetical protein PRUPE_1G002200 [Prunus persica]|uniref:Uncharacterized protein n=1 Tax=Prunus persica TaxID=3760 RepID=A0A251QQI1_PRUPE|nr:hypothetical protein PRUPE_1G002200 [Prunus persica]